MGRMTPDDPNPRISEDVSDVIDMIGEMLHGAPIRSNWNITPEPNNEVRRHAQA